MTLRVETVRDPATDAKVGIVTLDQASNRNALTGPMVKKLSEAFDGLEGDSEVGAIVVTGAPPAFCAGADLSVLGAIGDSSLGDPDGQSSRLRQVYKGFLRIAESPLPTVAAVNGPAVGAGLNLALACDCRIAGRSARFDSRFLKIGLHPGGGHTWMLRRAVDQQTVAAMVLFGQVLSGERAAQVGLAWACVDDDELVSTAVAFAAGAASCPAPVERRAKALIGSMGQVETLKSAMELELEAQLWSLTQPFFSERLAAMQARITKRPSAN